VCEITGTSVPGEPGHLTIALLGVS